MAQPTNIYRNLSVGATGAVVSARPTSVYGWQLSNTGAAVRYLKLYNTTSAPTSSDTPVMTVALGVGASYAVSFNDPIAFKTGLGIRAVTGVADNDNTGAGTNEVVVNVLYRS